MPASRVIDTRRGSPKGHYVNLGSIPARAGEPAQGRPGRPLRPVYPRACGGTTAGTIWPWPPGGLSPRVGGNRLRHQRRAAGGRSIPARAGEPHTGSAGRTVATVYPRACGGTSSGPTRIPCCRVYPRACGGTSLPVTPTDRPKGLSPRVRGNHCAFSAGHQRHGSIPARAGEPTPTSRTATMWWVYPRACGGTP